jgi:mannosyl-3-phosphoglycerate phosphatase
MSAHEVAKRAGLQLAAARRGRQREFDEPFVILEGDARRWPRLQHEIRKLGLHATRGSRFFHILGKNDKGAAVRRLAAWFRRASPCGIPLTVGLGDSPNDIPLLRAVNLPILVAGRSGRHDQETLNAVPAAKRAGGIGPAGWNHAVLQLLRRRARGRLRGVSEVPAAVQGKSITRG